MREREQDRGSTSAWSPHLLPITSILSGLWRGRQVWKVLCRYYENQLNLSPACLLPSSPSPAPVHHRPRSGHSSMSALPPSNLFPIPLPSPPPPRGPGVPARVWDTSSVGDWPPGCLYYVSSLRRRGTSQRVQTRYPRAVSLSLLSPLLVFPVSPHPVRWPRLATSQWHTPSPTFPQGTSLCPACGVCPAVRSTYPNPEWWWRRACSSFLSPPNLGILPT